MISTLPARWTALDPHGVQRAFYTSAARFNVVEAGRRSGKSEVCKRRKVRRALRRGFPLYRCLLGAPTQDQAIDLWLSDIIALIPPHRLRDIKLGRGEVHIDNGAHFKIAGLDEPRRIEGVPVDDGAVDEIADCRTDIWDKTLSPLVDTRGREGGLDFIGVPRPSSLLRRLSNMAQGLDPTLGKSKDWAYFHWTSEEILTPAAIAAARARTDPLLYAQEYLASRVNFAGRIYSYFAALVHPAGNLRSDLPYLTKSPLELCFDFNRAPGVCAVVQEHVGADGKAIDFALGEVHIPINSDTPAVCRKIIADWGKHEGAVYGYGDATGGNKGTAKLDGSDWDIIERMLGAQFRGRFNLRVPKANPKERTRINALNARICATDGTRRFFVHPRCTAILRDMDEVQVLTGSDGEIDKKHDLEVTHISDALGYRAFEKYPLGGEAIAPIDLFA